MHRYYIYIKAERTMKWGKCDTIADTNPTENVNLKFLKTAKEFTVEWKKMPAMFPPEYSENLLAYAFASRHSSFFHFCLFLRVGRLVLNL